MQGDNGQLVRERAQNADTKLSVRAEQALERVTARAQDWVETVRAYRRAYTKSRHFRGLAP